MKRRPALVVSPQAFNATFGLAFVVPITTKAKGHAFEVALPSEGAVRGVVMAHQLKSLDWRARRAEKISSAPAGVVAEVVEIVRDIIEGDSHEPDVSETCPPGKRS
jgi:mRNA interferase MazF